MSQTDTLVANTTSAGRTGIQLACPCCRSTEHLRTVEVIEVLAEARFSLDTSEPDYGDSESQLLPDTQHWQPAIFLNDPAAGAAEATQTTGATS